MAVPKERLVMVADESAVARERPRLEPIPQRNRGSYSTMGPALDEWDAEQAVQPSLPCEALPRALFERNAEAAAGVWRIAPRVAKARLDAESAGGLAGFQAERDESMELADHPAARV